MPARRNWGDLITGLTVVALAIVGFWGMYADPAARTLDFGDDPGPGLFPTILLAALGVMGVWLALSSLSRSAGGEGEEPRPGAGWRRLLLPAFMVVTLTGYVQVLPRLGFLTLSFAFALVWILLLGLEEGVRLTAGRLLRCAVEAGTLVGVIYVVFAKLVKVPLP